jgi:hypothetical protein
MLTNLFILVQVVLVCFRGCKTKLQCNFIQFIHHLLWEYALHGSQVQPCSANIFRFGDYKVREPHANFVTLLFHEPKKAPWVFKISLDHGNKGQQDDLAQHQDVLDLHVVTFETYAL